MVFKKNDTAWSKGLTGDPRCSRKGMVSGSSGRASSPEAELERKRKISESAKLKNGGYRQGSGRGKKGWFKGYFCDSSWELAYVIWCLDNGKSVERNAVKYEYEFEGKIRKFLPDFIVDGVLTEIKGYETVQFEAKRKILPEMVVLAKKEMEPVLQYVMGKYGKNFIELYEGGGVRGDKQT
jgi:hypothetical protein